MVIGRGGDVQSIERIGSIDSCRLVPLVILASAPPAQRKRQRQLWVLDAPAAAPPCQRP